MYALIVTTKEVRSGAKGNPIITQEGDRFWVVAEPEGWVEATTTRYTTHTNRIPYAVKAWDTIEAAVTFAKRWKGHPWWCEPNGEYEVVEVVPQYKQVLDGYKRA